MATRRVRQHAWTGGLLVAGGTASPLTDLAIERTAGVLFPTDRTSSAREVGDVIPELSRNLPWGDSRPACGPGFSRLITVGASANSRHSDGDPVVEYLSVQGFQGSRHAIPDEWTLVERAFHAVN